MPLSVINTATVMQEMKKARQIDEDQRSLWARSMFVYCNPLDDDILKIFCAQGFSALSLDDVKQGRVRKAVGMP